MIEFYSNLYMRIFMKKQKQEEQLFYISGWQNREDNDQQSDFCIKQLKGEADGLCKKAPLPLSKIPFREHQRAKTKEAYQSKKSDILILKQDKELLQKYIWKQNDFKLDSYRNSHQQEYLPLKRMQVQTQIMHLKHQNCRSTQLQVGDFHFLQKSRNYLEKYTLFSGINTQINKKRKFLLRANSKQNLQRPKLKTDIISQNIALMASKCNFNAKNQIKEQKSNNINQFHKKKLKFPLYFRQLTSKQQNIRKSKHNSVFNLQEKKCLKFSAEFMDDNIFSSKHIRQ